MKNKLEKALKYLKTVPKKEIKKQFEKSYKKFEKIKYQTEL